MQSQTVQLLIGLLLGLYASQPGAAEAKRGDARVLLLGVFENGSPSKQLSSELSAALEGGNELVSADGLLPSQRECRQHACLAELAESRHVARIIGADISAPRETAAAEDLRKIDMFVYDHHRRSGEVETVLCSAEETMSYLAQLADRLLRKTHGHAAAQDLGPRDDILEDLRIIRRERPPSFPAWRSALAAGLGTVFVVSLASAVALSVLHHRATDGTCDDAPELKDPKKDTTCAWNSTSLFALGYSVAGASGIGFALTLGLR